MSSCGDSTGPGTPRSLPCSPRATEGRQVLEDSPNCGWGTAKATGRSGSADEVRDSRKPDLCGPDPTVSPPPGAKERAGFSGWGLPPRTTSERVTATTDPEPHPTRHRLPGHGVSTGARTLLCGLWSPKAAHDPACRLGTGGRSLALLALISGRRAWRAALQPRHLGRPIRARLRLLAALRLHVPQSEHEPAFRKECVQFPWERSPGPLPQASWERPWPVLPNAHGAASPWRPRTETTRTFALSFFSV